MSIINIVVLNFLENTDSFLGIINEAYAEPLQARKNKSLEELIAERNKYWHEFAKIRIRPKQIDEITVQFFPAPTHKDNPSKTEMIWETLLEGAHGFLVIIPDNEPKIQADAAELIQIFLSYLPLPFLILLKKHQDNSRDTKEIQEALKLEPTIPLIEYENLNGETIKEIIPTIFEHLNIK